MDARELIAHHSLAPHPEGGHFRETYRSALACAPPDARGPRSLATSILYLLEHGERSAWHRVSSDELWLWQGGCAMALRVGERVHRVGPHADAGDEPQVLVSAGEWQSATPAAADGGPPWSLVACVVVPGFDFADFELRGD